MSYTINLTNGNLFATIPDGTINTTSSMTLIGKNYAGYGQFLDDNFIHLLENGANGTQPGSPLTGQVWYNTTSGVLNVYNGVGFKPIGGANAQSSAPTNNAVGDLWYDTVNQQLNVYAGVSAGVPTGWLLVGPVYTPSTGVTGAIPSVIQDNASANHTVIELYVGSSIVGIISKDAAFTPANAIAGFTQVLPGITLASSVGSQIPLFQGTATNALTLNGIPASSYVTTGAGSPIFSTTGITNANSAGVGSIGNVAVPFGDVYATTFHGTAVTALYADVAERFAADDVYEAGTIVEIGGSMEITKSTTELSNKVFGVISTRAAYLMNGGAGNDATHPPVAMTGRVPVKVTGTVNKGDRLVSAGNGIARVALDSELTPFNVIGRALSSKTDSGLGTIEAIVTIKS